MTETPSIPRPRERLIVAALTCTAFAAALNVNAIGALGPFVQDELDLDAGQLGVLIGSAGIAGTIGALLLGPVVDRVGRRPPLLIGTIVFAIVSAIATAVDGYELHVALRITSGFAGGVVYTGVSAAIADVVPYERRGAAMGLLTGAVFLALPVGMPLALAFANSGWWQGVFGIQAVAAGVAVLLMARSVPAQLGIKSESFSQFGMLREPMVLPALLSVAMYTGAFFMTVQFAGKWLDDAELLPRSEQHAMWVVLGVASVLGGAVVTRLADRIGKRNFVLWATAIVAGLILLLGRVASITGLLLVGIPLAVVAAARSGALMALISQLVHERARATLMGVRAAAVNIGMGVFPAIGGLIYVERGYDGVVQAAVAGIVVAYLLVRLFVREPSQ